MSDFHYVRTLGTDGGVDVCSGPAIGLDLASVLADGLPPYNVALQIVAGMCEILDIAEEDGEVHGNLELENVFVDDTGAVSMEGFRQARTRAPEGRPQGHETDLYGLGFVAYRLLSGLPFPALPTDAEPHDDAVIDVVLAMDLRGLPEGMVGDVQWFMAKLLSHDPDDRPSAVECWRTFVAFAGEVQGPEFVQWCLDALDGGGARRTPGEAPPPEEDDPEETGNDELESALVSRGPLGGAGLAFDNAPAAGGTAFFSKADMKAALETDVSVTGFRPAAGGGSATNYWTKDQLQAMAAGGSEAPRPKRAQGEGERRKTLAMSKSAVQDLQRAQEQQGTPEVPPARPPNPARPAPSAPQPKRPEQESEFFPREPPRRPSQPAGPPPQAPAPPPPSGSPFAESFGPPDAFEHAEPTIRMKAMAVRTTRTPAPSPQVHRPPRVPSRAPSSAPSPASSAPAAVSEPPRGGQAPSAMAQEETVLQKLTDIPGYAEAVQASPPRQPSAPPAPAERYDADYFARSAEDGETGPRQLPVEPPVPAYQPPTHVEEGGGNLALIAGIAFAIVISLVACFGLGGMGMVVAWFAAPAGQAQHSLQPVPTPVAVPEPAPDPGPSLPVPDTVSGTRPDPTPGTRPDPAPDTRPGPAPGTRPDPAPGPRPGSSPDPRPVRPDPQPVRPDPAPVRPTPQPVRPAAPTPTPEPADPDQPVTLTLKSSGRGRLNCPGVGVKPFDGNTTLNIEPYQLPATCVVEMDKQKAAFQVFASGVITCNASGARVDCDKGSVP